MNTKIFLLALSLAFASLGFAQEAKYQLSSHILDITQGKPAPNVKISLSKRDKSGKWNIIDEKYTDKNGRIKDFLKEGKETEHQGVYKLTYFVEPYFEKLNQSSFYPFIEVVFKIKDDNHYHVPITLSPFGYSTYRGN
ncbi:hydroxyisourate hydrolase [Sunxiuqinia sp. sy24]|uniref:hydroxyisourate hydrolase n=1 Tax=Sunxiuqinia sp. sy24 TaxID=3461495 RepID=UPI0040459DCA